MIFNKAPSSLILTSLIFAFLLSNQSEAQDAATIKVSNSKELIDAAKLAKEGTTILLAEGRYEIPHQLVLKKGMTLKGAGLEKTTITHSDSWRPAVKSLPDPEMKTKNLDTSAYLIRLDDKASHITVSDVRLTGAQLHGAIYGFANEQLYIHHVRVEDFLWSGIRTFMMKAKIHDCEFIDAGGRWKRGGIPGNQGGITGGALFAIWMKDSEIFNNRFRRTQMQKKDEFYGIKIRQGKQSRIHHNTIEVNFSIEMPFENDEDVEIDHNVLWGTVSIPKHSGGIVPKSGSSFHIHHNYFKKSYSIEFVRNGIEIDHNLFDFDPNDDGGNLISGFGKAPAKGPALFHNNLINNPGRGVIWINEPYGHLTVRNNHVRTNTTKTPRRDGLFGFNKDCDFSTIQIKNNIVECKGIARPLFRNSNSYKTKVMDNKLVNVADVDKLSEQRPNRNLGLESPLKFKCGVGGEANVDGWIFSEPTK